MACSTAIGPSHADLENKFKVSMPPAWTLVSFKVTAEENAGTQTQPDIRSRVVVMVLLARDLYESQEYLLGKQVLVRTKAAGDVKFELHGIARSRRSGGAWNVDFDWENARNIDAPGKPLSDYSDYVLAGSPEEQALRAESAKQEEAEQKERIRAENARAESERIAQENQKALTRTTGALFTPGARLISRWVDSQTKETGALTLVVEKHDPLTRTFSGILEHANGKQDAISGSYDNRMVTIERNDHRCRLDLITTGAVPRLNGKFSGPLLGGCGQGGTIEVGL